MSLAPEDTNPFTPPVAEVGANIPSGRTAGGMPFGGFLIIYFFASLIFMWVFRRHFLVGLDGDHDGVGFFRPR